MRFQGAGAFESNLPAAHRLPDCSDTDRHRNGEDLDIFPILRPSVRIEAMKAER